MSCRSVEDMHEQIINLFYAYIDNFQRMRIAQDQIPNLQTTADNLQAEIDALRAPTQAPRVAARSTVVYTMTVPAIIKPEYAEYIATYGHPADGVFESAKLAEFL